MEIDDLKPSSNYILVRKCGLGDDIGNKERGIRLDNGKALILPTDYHEQTNFCEIIDIGPDVIFFLKEHTARHSEEKIGATILVPEDSHNLHCVDYELCEYWMVRECEPPPKTDKEKRRYRMNLEGAVVSPIIYG